MTISRNRISAFILFLILAVFLATAFWNLGKSYLYDWDEAIYAQVAKETGFSFSPYWNGQPWFEKPPLVFWLTKLSFLLFGENEFGARFFMPILGMGSLVFFFLLIKERKSEKTALLGLTFFLIAPLFLARSQSLNTDGALLFSLMASFYFLTRLEKKLTSADQKKVSFEDYFYPALTVSFGVLSKGLMGFLPGPIWFFYLLFSKREFFLRTIKSWLIVGVLALLLILPWHIYQAVRFGSDFWQVYFIEHILRRVNQPIEYHFGGKLYYVKFLISELSWRLVLPFLGGFFWLFDQIKKKKLDENFIFFLVWGGFVLGLFTFAKTKLFWYILPLYPVLAVFWGQAWEKVSSFRKNLFLVPIILFLILALNSTYKSAVKKDKPLPSTKVALAQKAKKNCPEPLLVLVDKNERAAADILPEELTLSSSFSYGGSPALVFYYGGRVDFFYQIDRFQDRLIPKKKAVCAMITKEDYKNLSPKNSFIAEEKEWLLIK